MKLPDQWLVIGQAYSEHCYVDEILVVRNNWWGKMIQRFYQFLDRHQTAIVKYDFESLDVKDGDIIPRYALSYWWFLPYRFANKYFKRLRRNYETT